MTDNIRLIYSSWLHFSLARNLMSDVNDDDARYTLFSKIKKKKRRTIACVVFFVPKADSKLSLPMIQNRWRENKKQKKKHHLRLSRVHLFSFCHEQCPLGKQSWGHVLVDFQENLQMAEQFLYLHNKHSSFA